MFDYRTGPLAVFVLRVALGLMFLAHGIDRDEGRALDTSGNGRAIRGPRAGGGTRVRRLWRGRPGQARWVSLGIVPILIGAALAHWGNGWLLLNDGGGWESSLYLTVLAITQALIGEGRLPLTPTRSLGSLKGPPPELSAEAVWRRSMYA